MNEHPFLSDLDLAALLCSRVCHDVISPVGAIANGLEVLEEEDDEEMRKIAFDLVSRSAKQASAKLQFCRIAFGAAGSAGASIDMGEAGDVARMFVGEEKVRLDWQLARETRPKLEVKLVLNMLLIGIAAIPRGGVVEITGEGSSMTVRAKGDNAKLPDKAVMVFGGAYQPEDLDARSVQAYYAMRLAQQAGLDLSMSADGADIVIATSPRPEAIAAA